MYFVPPKLNLATGLVAAKRGLKLRQKRLKRKKWKGALNNYSNRTTLNATLHWRWRQRRQ